LIKVNQLGFYQLIIHLQAFQIQMLSRSFWWVNCASCHSVTTQRSSIF